MPKQTNVSGQRKLAHLLGLIFIISGAILFISVFFSTAKSFGNFENFNTHIGEGMTRGIIGMLLILVGNVLMAIARRGLAGSGLVLDMEQERADLEPLNRMVGGQIKDVLDEVDLKNTVLQENKTSIKVRCQSCQELNDEGQKFCGSCGTKI